MAQVLELLNIIMVVLQLSLYSTRPSVYGTSVRAIEHHYGSVTAKPILH